MPDNARSGLLRRLVPRRRRWLARVALRAVTGWYIREHARRLDSAADRLSILETNIEASTDAHTIAIDSLSERLQSVEQSLLAISHIREDLEKVTSRVAELHKDMDERSDLVRQEMFDIAQRVPTRAVTGDEWEPWLTDHIPAAGDIFLDIGASIGQYSVRLASAYRKVIAFEPNPRPLERLWLAVAPLDNVQLDDRAVSNFSGTLKLYLYADDAQTSVLPEHREASAGNPIGEINVPCIRLDDLTFDGKVDFIKIDTEGGEVQAVEGALRTISRFRPQMLIEIHSRDNASIVADLIRPLGYECEQIRHPDLSLDSPFWLEHSWLACKATVLESARAGGRRDEP